MSNKPLSVDQALIKAKTLARKGAPDQAMQLYQGVLNRFPGNKRAIEGLKSLTGSAPEPGSPTQQQINDLIALYKQRRLQEALEQGTALAERYPDMPLILNILGAVSADMGRLVEAVAVYSTILRLKPDYAKAHYNLGNVLKAQGKHEEAVARYLKAVALQPDYAEAHNNLGSVLYDLGRHDEAVASLTSALKLKPDNAAGHNSLGAILYALGKHHEAVANYRQAVKIAPDFAEAHYNLSAALNILGEHDGAVASLTRTLQLKPDYAEAQRVLGTLEKCQTDDPRIARMLNQIASTQIAEDDKMHLSFALGKAYGDIGDAEDSFKHYREGNRLRKKELGYDLGYDKRLFGLIKSIFGADDPPALEGTHPVAGRSKRPIFIVGMPRSGTTLTEQILSSHSQVYGAGEISVMRRAVMPHLENIRGAQSGKLTSMALSEIRDEYLTEVIGLGGGAHCVADKLPLNFRFIGLILAAIPEARIINLQRNPVATCWSIFTHYFSGAGNGYAYDLVDVAEFYKLYVDLMGFWREKFPNRIYDINYEALTESPEKETRKLLEYCGLGWEDQCLEFHKTKRAVNTASSGQVRQEMYTGSSEAWRKYEAHLAPLLQALKG